MTYMLLIHAGSEVRDGFKTLSEAEKKQITEEYFAIAHAPRVVGGDQLHPADTAGEEPGALAAVAQALTLATPEGWLRVFVDEGVPMEALHGKVITAARQAPMAGGGDLPPDNVARLVEVFEEPGQTSRIPPGRGDVPSPGLVAPLTSREREVLGLLAAGKPNQAIAHELVVTLDTVKRHVTHILGKLGVANRTQAAVRARELGLLS
jgi:LuxR family transcriptional regulator, maltose regulon positive regulatory protein